MIFSLIFGAFIGWIASIFMKKNESMGAIANIIVGIVGSGIGGWIGSAIFNNGNVKEFSIYGIVMSVVGACILLFIVDKVTGKR